ncbi:MAG: MbnP family protein [Schleiferiaceae bacterium]
MKRFLLLTLVFGSLSLAAQTKELVLNFHHVMDGQVVTDSLVGTNNLGNQFKFNRLQYYVDDIEIIYDQGDTFTYPQVLLINALEEELTSVDLGSLSFDSITAVRFAVGVGPDVNNLDPSTYPAAHPLAPKSPSMHWGWAAGYRFVCAEGVGSSAFNQTFELHGLGNANYAMQTIATSGTAVGSDTLKIDIEADYAELVRDIEVAQGTISHGETGDAYQSLKNLNNKVFKSTEGNVALVQKELAFEDLSVFPNPSNGRFIVTGIEGATIEVFNALGSKMYSLRATASTRIILPDAGIYLMVVSKNGSTTTKKLIVR